MNTTTPSRIASTAAAVAAVLEHAHQAGLPEPCHVTLGLGRPQLQVRTVAEVAEWALYLGTQVVSSVSIADPTVLFHDADGQSLELAVRVYTTTRTEATA